MVERCDWSDHFVELQLWIRLTALAFEDSLHTVVMHCSGKALNLASLFCDKDKPPRDRCDISLDLHVKTHAHTHTYIYVTCKLL